VPTYWQQCTWLHWEPGLNLEQAAVHSFLARTQAQFNTELCLLRTCYCLLTALMNAVATPVDVFTLP
jgi:hypothetical protein